MKMVRNGFIVIEMLAAVALGAVIVVGAFSIFRFARTALTRSQSIASYVTFVPIIEDQIDKDLSALCPAPQKQRDASQGDASQSASKTKGGAGENEQVGSKQKDSPTDTKKAREKDPPGFFLEQDSVQGTEPSFSYRLRTLAFITTQRIPAYRTYGARYVRVIYRLVPQADEGHTVYQLKRYQTADLTVSLEDIYAKQSGTVVCDYVRELECTLTVQAPEKKDETASSSSNSASAGEQSGEENEQRLPRYDRVNQWDPQKVDDVSALSIPVAVRLRGTYEQTEVQDSIRHLWCEVPVYAAQALTAETMQRGAPFQAGTSSQTAPQGASSQQQTSSPQG